LPELPGEEISAEGLERRAVERSLELAASRAAIDSAARQAGMTRPLGVLSELELGVSAEREEGDWGVGPAVALPIPIFSQGQPAVAAAAARARQAMNDHQALAVWVRSAARAGYARLITARRRAEYFQKVVLPLRRQVTEHIQRRHNAMLVGAFELLSAKREEIEAGRAYIEALRDYWVARARMEGIMAGVLPEGEDPRRDAKQREEDEKKRH
jgi:outer membrane protein TolC